MKFKKVKIQAFKAYNKAEDGTFDFSLENNDYADFVSIYAPNGFGKTSFYDAVEWGITKNIHRFLRKQKFNSDTAKSERNISSSEKQYILRNHFADPNLDGYVEIITADSDKPIRRDLVRPKKGGFDYKFNEKETEKKYFKEVILSQEWIDAFLKEDDAQARYRTFVEYFGDKELDQYYKGIIDLINTNAIRISTLRSQLLDVQKELNFDGDKNILKTINEKIDELNAAGENVNIITDSFTEEDSIELSVKISDRLSQLKFTSEEKQNLVKSIESAFIGSDEIISLDQFLKSIVKLGLLEEKSKVLIDLLLLIDEKDLKHVDIETSQSKLIALNQDKRKIDDLIVAYQEYIKISKEIVKRQNLINSELKKIEGLEASKSDQAQQQILFNSKYESIHTQILSKQAELKDAKELFDAIEVNLKDVATSNEIKITLESKIETISKQQKILEDEVARFRDVISNLSINALPPILEKKFIIYSKNVEKIEAFSEELNQLNTTLKTLNETIKNQESLNDELANFITKGSELIKKNHDSTCPLCCHEYDSYSILADRISSNTAISESLQILLNDRIQIESNIQIIQEKFTSEINKLSTLMRDNLEIEDKILSNTNVQLSDVKASYAELTLKIEILLSKRSEYSQITNDLTLAEYLIKTEKDLSLLIQEKDSLSNNIELLKQAINLTIENLATSTRVIKKNQEDINLLELDESYGKIIFYFKDHFPASDISKEILEKAKKENDTQIEENRNHELSLKEQVSRIDEKLKSETRESLNQRLLELTSNKIPIQKELDQFRQFINSNFRIDLNDSKSVDLEQILNDQRKEYISLITKNTKLVNAYSTLYEIKNIVEPFLKYEKAKKSVKGIRERIKFLETNVAKALKTEKSKVANYIDAQINSFFFEDLINDLYSKIDPHPEYKKIKFVCDFKEDKPKLNVCMAGRENEYLIPNLYFSTAQLNILSLSIFLAKALNAKDDQGKSIDCIFIDDPIQSMDSINILSTIDLFRSIVVNLQKQVILSTHDENFHNLLKKKMPENLFKSKFIELETFGKVKRDTPTY